MTPDFPTRTQPRPEPQPTSAPRVLILRIGAMGDVLHALPAVAGLRLALPGCTIGWAVDPRWAPLLTSPGHPGPILDHVHLVNSRQWQSNPLTLTTGANIAALRRELRAAHYDLCIDLQGSVKSAIIGKLASAPRFTGPAHPREAPARLLYTHRVLNTHSHVIPQAAELVSAALQQRIPPAPVLFPTNPESEAWCTAALVRAGIGEHFVLLSPAAGWGAKQWAARHYSQLALRLRDSGFGVVVNSPAAGPDAALANTIAQAGDARSLASTIPQLIALTGRADLVIGGDSGPIHLAAALGRPVVALFGPTDPKRNGPHFNAGPVTVLRHPSSLTSHKRLAQSEPGLALITVDEVEAAAFSLLGATLLGANPELTHG